MYLRNVKTLWGIPVEDIRKQGKKYRTTTNIIYLADILIAIGAGVCVYLSGADIVVCVLTTFSITLLCLFILALIANPRKLRAYTFLRKYRNNKIENVNLSLDTSNLKSILYCSGYRRRKCSKMTDTDSYKDAMINACCEDPVYAKRLGKLIYKLGDASTVNSTNKIIAVILVRRKKHYLVDFSSDAVDN